MIRLFRIESLSEYELFQKDAWDWFNKPYDLRYKQLEAAASHYNYKFANAEYYYSTLLSNAEALLRLIEDQ